MASISTSGMNGLVYEYSNGASTNRMRNPSGNSFCCDSFDESEDEFSQIDQRKLQRSRSTSRDPQNNPLNPHPHFTELHSKLVHAVMENNGDFTNFDDPATSDRTKRIQALWKPPTGSQHSLRLHNSFTRQKEIFIPEQGKRVLWYTCGPTVYDASHMGHARAYITFDILRRVLTDYFGYDVTYAMNITDIDDKIIKRARIRHLLDYYKESAKDNATIIADLTEALSKYQAALVAKRPANDADDSNCPLTDIYRNCDQLLKSFILSNDSTPPTEFWDSFSDPLGNLLNERLLNGSLGYTITDNAIFAALPRYWENDFHCDMKSLNVFPADILTRVSEYVPEIIEFIKKIIANGYAYVGQEEGKEEKNYSVYFDTISFDKSGKHHYAKLVPESFGNKEALAEGEGDLSQQGTGKRQAMDFALWKASKDGEPSWESPWGFGRPGWHIECSVMATEVLGQKLDIHAGGVDLKFPHHDNEIAQSEACFESDSWINYFLHSGHLHIRGHKMSKSLKNFITIKEALKKNTARQIRIAFLQHSWVGGLDYSDEVMDGAVLFEKSLNEFFLNLKDLIRNSAANLLQKPSKEDLILRHKFYTATTQIHEALCDSVDTKTVLDTIRSLMKDTNTYIKEQQDSKQEAHPALLMEIGRYLSKMMRIFGVIESDNDQIGFSLGDKSSNTEEAVLPYVKAFAEFREEVRRQAQTIKNHEMLALCDKLRNDILPNLGVRLEDREGQPTAIKLVDREILMREREQKLKLEEEKRMEKERKRQKDEQDRLVKEKQKQIPPGQLFINQTDKYSKFDSKGIPTHDAEGKELSKSQLKKLQKLYEQQEAKFNDRDRRENQNGPGQAVSNAPPNGNGNEHGDSS